MNRPRTILLLALIALATAACGHKGPLFLPDANESPAAPVEDAEESEDHGSQA